MYFYAASEVRRGRCLPDQRRVASASVPIASHMLCGWLSFNQNPAALLLLAIFGVQLTAAFNNH